MLSPEQQAGGKQYHVLHSQRWPVEICCMMQAIQIWCSVTSRDGMGWEVRERFKREGTCVYLQLIYVYIEQKPTQYCKAIILQLKIKKIKNKKQKLDKKNILFLSVGTTCSCNISNTVFLSLPIPSLPWIPYVLKIAKSRNKKKSSVMISWNVSYHHQKQFWVSLLTLNLKFAFSAHVDPSIWNILALTLSQ